MTRKCRTLPDMGNNLRRLRIKKGWTHEEAGRHMNMSRSGFIKLERGERQLTGKHIRKAADAFGVSEGDVIADKPPPLVGWVGAGSEAHYYGHGQPAPEDDADDIPFPPNQTVDTVAVEVRGDSLGPMFNRWLVYYDDVRCPPTDDLLGQLCVVGLSDDRVLVKRLMRGSLAGHFHLLSATESPIENVIVEWAAKVTAMAPRK